MRATSRIGLFGAVLLAGGMLWLTGANASAAGDDIAGVVRSASGGEAGVWVIAETDDLETRSARSSSPATTGGSWFRTCRTPTTRCGYAATAWSTPGSTRRAPATSSPWR